MTPTEEITIRVDAEVARAYRAASEEERRKFDLLLSLRLHDALHHSGSLKDLMRDISRKAQERGLTPEQPPFDESWREVIQQRSAELRSGQVTPVPWEEVKRQAREKADG